MRLFKHPLRNSPFHPMGDFLIFENAGSTRGKSHWARGELAGRLGVGSTQKRMRGLQLRGGLAVRRTSGTIIAGYCVYVACSIYSYIY